MADISRQLLEQVGAAQARQGKLNIMGSGSKSFLGREPSGDAINVAGHSGILSWEPAELVISARAATPLREVDAALAERGQMLSFEPPQFAAKGTLGGTLACNLSGPGRPWQGAIRDMVLGVRLINGRGEHLRFGGQVMKNVAGYDVTRLQAGAMGIFGIITEISLKVLPKPAATLTLAHVTDVWEAIRTMHRLGATPTPLSAACWLEDRLYLRLSGAASAVANAAAQLPGEAVPDANRFWADLRDQKLSFFAGSAPLWRFSLRSNCDHFLPDAPWLIDWGGTQRWLRGDHDRAVLEAAATGAGGQVSAFRGCDRRAEVFQDPPAPLRLLHERLKTAFDPDRLFNPGRLYSWL